MSWVFDDVTDNSDLYDDEKVARSRPVMAQRVVEEIFAKYIENGYVEGAP